MMVCREQCSCCVHMRPRTLARTPARTSAWTSAPAPRTCSIAQTSAAPAPTQGGSGHTLTHRSPSFALLPVRWRHSAFNQSSHADFGGQAALPDPPCTFMCRPLPSHKGRPALTAHLGGREAVLLPQALELRILLHRPARSSASSLGRALCCRQHGSLGRVCGIRRGRSLCSLSRIHSGRGGSSVGSSSSRSVCGGVQGLGGGAPCHELLRHSFVVVAVIIGLAGTECGLLQAAARVRGCDCSSSALASWHAIVCPCDHLVGILMGVQLA